MILKIETKGTTTFENQNREKQDQTMRTMRASRTTAMLDLLHSQNSRSSIGSSRKSSTTTTTLVLSSIFLLFSLLIQSTHQTIFSKSRSPSTATAEAEAATPTVIPLKKHFWHHESLYPLTSNDKKNFLFLNTTFITYTANISFTLKQQQQQQQNVEQELDKESQSSSLTRSRSEMEVKNQPFVLDTTSSFSFVYCCDSPVIKNQTTPTGSNKDEVFCVQSSNCQKCMSVVISLYSTIVFLIFSKSKQKNNKKLTKSSQTKF